MPTERLDCPICGAMFLRSVKASKTCSRACSHQLVKRQPRLPKYAKPKPSAHDRVKAIGAEIRAAMARQRGMS